MASDNHANYGKIGFAIVLGVAAIVATLVYLGGYHGRDDEMLIETFYDKPVSGLSVGSPVNFRGVKVGEVREIGFICNKYNVTGNDLYRIYLLMAIKPKLFTNDVKDPEGAEMALEDLVKAGLRATVTVNGITGLSRVECDLYTDPQPVAPISWKPRYGFVPPQISLLDSFSVAATKAMNRLKAMDFASVWSNVQTIAESTARLSENANVLVESQRSGVSSILRNVEEVTDDMRTLSQSLKENPSILLRSRDPEPLPETEK